MNTSENTRNKTVTEFLLDRIADDKEWARVNAAGKCAPGWTSYVLAECEAKRQIVDLHPMSGNLRGPVTDNKFETCEMCGPFDWPFLWDDETRRGEYAPEPEAEFGFYPCDTLKALASVYADHPDYRDEWRLGSER